MCCCRRLPNHWWRARARYAGACASLWKEISARVMQGHGRLFAACGDQRRRRIFKQPSGIGFAEAWNPAGNGCVISLGGPHPLSIHVQPLKRRQTSADARARSRLMPAVDGETRRSGPAESPPVGQLMLQVDCLQRFRAGSPEVYPCSTIARSCAHRVRFAAATTRWPHWAWQAVE